MAVLMLFSILAAGVGTVLPASAAADSPPMAVTTSYASDSATSGALSGTVNPGGDSATYDAVYDLQASTWCSTDGMMGTPTYMASDPSYTIPVGTDQVNVTVELTSLTAGMEYCAAIEAVSSGGDTISTPITFTQGLPPVVSSTGFTEVDPTDTTVTASINPLEQSGSYYVAYDTSTSQFCGGGGPDSTTIDTATETFDGTADVSASATLSGLTAGGSYCAEVVATNGSGTTDGSLITFTQDLPAATTTSVASTGQSAATVEGTVNPDGQSTTYSVEYDVSGSAFCSNTSAPDGTTVDSTAVPLTGTGTAPVGVSVELSGLAGGQGYCMAIVATNSSGTDVSPVAVDLTQWVPIVTSPGFTEIDPADTTISASINPTGQPGSYYVAYDTSISQFCGGSDTTAASDTATQTFDGTGDVSASATLSGLTAAGSYCAQLVATNGSGTSRSSLINFTQGIPTATTTSASSTSATAATVDGTVNPDGASGTTYYVIYDTTDSVFCGGSGSNPPTDTSTLGSVAAGTAAVDVSATVSGLAGGQSYCLEIVATNSYGTGTSPATVTLAQGFPVVTNPGYTEIDPTHTTVTASIDPVGQSGTYHVTYDTSTSPFCGGSGAATAPSSTTAQTFDGTADVSASATLSGLTAAGSYCAEVVAATGSGTIDSALISFTQGIPAATTADAYSTAETTATVDGSVNPDGQSTSYYVAYDLQGSAFCKGTSATPTYTYPSSSATDLSNPAPIALTGTGSTGTNTVSVSVDLTGLSRGANYCLVLVAKNSYGVSANATPDAITLGQGDPTAQTFEATDTGANTAEVDGAIDPLNASAQDAWSYQVIYDVQTSAFCHGTAASDSTTHYSGWQVIRGEYGDNEIDVSADLPGTGNPTQNNPDPNQNLLTPGQAYCAAFEGSNAAGYTQDPGASRVDFVAGDPSTYINDVTSLTATSVEVDGEVNSSGQSTTYYVGYGLQGSNFCQGGTSTPQYTSGSAIPLGNTSTAATPVTVDVAGLLAGQNYCAALIAHNASGNSPINAFDFTAGVPSASTTDAALIYGNVATIEGLVSPVGQTTTYYVGYDLASSDFCNGITQNSTLLPTYMSYKTTLAASAPSSSSVEVQLTGLSTNTTYCAIVIAYNASGTSPYQPSYQSVQFTTNSTIVSTTTGGGSGGSGGSGSGSSGSGSSSSGGSGSGGSSSGGSTTIATITSAQVVKALKGITLPSGKLRTVAGILSKSVTENFTAPTAGTLRIVWTVKYRRETYTIVSATVSVSAGKHQVKLKLNATGRRLLKDLKRHVAVTDTELFSPRSGAVGSTTKHFTLK